MDISRIQTNWIWLPEWEPADADEPRIVLFRKEFELMDVPGRYAIRISADSRYKLYVNGCFVQEGPQKAISLQEWYVDTADVAPFLRQGKNVAAVVVLRYPAPNPAKGTPVGNDSLLYILGVRPTSPGFKTVQVIPHPGRLSYAHGDVITPLGTIHVEWKKDEKGQIILSCQLPETISIG